MGQTQPQQSLGSPRFKHVVASAGTFCSQSSAYTFAWIMGKREHKHRNKCFAFHAAQEKPLTATQQPGKTGVPEQRKPAAAGRCLRTRVSVTEVTLVISHGVFQNSPGSPGLFCFRYLWVRWERHLTLSVYDTHKEVTSIRNERTFTSLLGTVAVVYPGGVGYPFPRMHGSAMEAQRLKD